MEDYLWEFTEADESTIRQYIEEANVTRPIALVLNSRNIALDKVGDFLNPSLSSLGDPYLLPGTFEAAKCLWAAIQNGRRIVIHGDYDTDGITASALLAWVLRRNGAEVSCYLPHRLDDGYGLTPDSIRKADVHQEDLLVTVDCGITSYEAVRYAKENHLDLVITDHHTPGPEPIEALAVVDPKLPGAPTETLDMAGVGVAFKVAQAFLKYAKENHLGGDETDLSQVLDLVALGTVADIVPLLNENRILVKHGLAVLARQQRAGVHALCDISGVKDTITTQDITYRLAPRINATGRMGDPTDSLRLLESNSMVSATELARVLDQHNHNRQSIEEEVVKAAEEQIASRCNLDQVRTIVVWAEHWHQGVVGIVASRLTRKYHRPSVVLTLDPSGQYTGSARSIRRLNLVDLLGECSETLARFGGHAMAAGLSLDADKLEAFCTQFDSAVQKVLGSDAMKPQLNISGDVLFSELDDIFFEELKSLEPFGHSNTEPVFRCCGVMPEMMKFAGAQHTRGYVADPYGNKMSFIAFGRLPASFPPPPWDIVFTPHINKFNDVAVKQLRILDVKSSV